MSQKSGPANVAVLFSSGFFCFPTLFPVFFFHGDAVLVGATDYMTSSNCWKCVLLWSVNKRGLFSIFCIGNRAAEAQTPFLAISLPTRVRWKFIILATFLACSFAVLEWNIHLKVDEVVHHSLQSPSITTPGTDILQPEVVFRRNAQTPAFISSSSSSEMVLFGYVCKYARKQQEYVTLLRVPLFNSSTWW